MTSVVLHRYLIITTCYAYIHHGTCMGFTYSVCTNFVTILYYGMYFGQYRSRNKLLLVNIT